MKVSMQIDTVCILVELTNICNTQTMFDKKMLQAILDKVTAVDSKVENLGEKLDNTEKRLTKRIDKLGIELAELSDDAPTVEEFDSLEKRVTKLENGAILA